MDLGLTHLLKEIPRPTAEWVDDDDDINIGLILNPHVDLGLTYSSSLRNSAPNSGMD